MPAEFGDWNSIFRRFRRWAKNGVWSRILEQVSEDPDLEHLIIDHPGASACSRRKRGIQNQAIGRSCGGLTTKIHIAVDALGNPLRLIATADQVHDSTQAEALVDGFAAAHV